MKKAAVIIPNWNGMKYLPRCIASLRNQTTDDFDILVVENASTDGSREWLEENHVPYLREETNLGFAGGVNAGIRAVENPYVILLNNDTEVFPDFTEQLLKAIEKHGKIFSVSSLMIRCQDHSAVDDAGDGMSLPGWAYQRGTEEPVTGFLRPADVFSACGGAAIYRTEVLKRIGMFDESHFAYLEDIDLGWRAKLAGYFNRYCPAARVYHYGSATSGSKYNDFKVRLAARNHIRLMYKNQPDWQLFLNAPFLLAGLMVKAAFFRKMGMYEAWKQGTLEGFRNLGTAKRVDFSAVPVYRILSVEWEMVLGTAEYLRHLLARR